MDRTVVARQLLRLAKEVMAIDFPTKDAMDDYLDEHPGADRSNHRVVEKNKSSPKQDSSDSEQEDKNRASEFKRDMVLDVLDNLPKGVDESDITENNVEFQADPYGGVNMRLKNKGETIMINKGISQERLNSFLRLQQKAR